MSVIMTVLSNTVYSVVDFLSGFSRSLYIVQNRTCKSTNAKKQQFFLIPFTLLYVKRCARGENFFLLVLNYTRVSLNVDFRCFKSQNVFFFSKRNKL